MSESMARHESKHRNLGDPLRVVKEDKLQIERYKLKKRMILLVEVRWAHSSEEVE